jgi:hypothetical protein
LDRRVSNLGVRFCHGGSFATLAAIRRLMRERIERIDELNGRIAQLRDQNRRLDAENEHLCEMVRLLPGDPF